MGGKPLDDALHIDVGVSFFGWLFVVGGAVYGGGDGAMGAFVVVGGFGRG